MSARFEAIALKKLQEIIHDRGISAEAIFSKFDNNGDGSLDVEEFKRAVASITGQNAPDAIIRAVFSALDSDGNQGLDLAELIALVEGGQAPAVSGEVTEIEISDHTNSNFNGVYSSKIIQSMVILVLASQKVKHCIFMICLMVVQSLGVYIQTV